MSSSEMKNISECDQIQLSYFIEHKPNKIKSNIFQRLRIFILADAYYCTKNGKIKGIMTLTEHLVMFNPIKCSENEQFVSLLLILIQIFQLKDLQQYQAIIDL